MHAGIGKEVNLVSQTYTNRYCESCFVNNVPPCQVNESPTNNQNRSRNFLIIAPIVIYMIFLTIITL